MNTTYNVTIIIDGAALREVSSAQRSWSGWMMVCQPIIDGAARSPSVLMDLRSCHLSGSYGITRSVFARATAGRPSSVYLHNDSQSIIDGLIVGECVSRGRPQEGRAVFNDVDFDSGDGSSSIVNSSSFC